MSRAEQSRAEQSRAEQSSLVLAFLGAMLVSMVASIYVLVATRLLKEGYITNLRISLAIVNFTWLSLTIGNYRGLKRYTCKCIICSSILVILVAISMVNEYWSQYYTIFPIQAINQETNGFAATDLMYFSTLSESFKNYGYPSALINNAEFHNYHFVGMAIVGIIAKITCMPAIYIYSYLVPIIAFPLFFFLLLCVPYLYRNLCNQGNSIIGFPDVILVSCFLTYFFISKEMANMVTDLKLDWLVSISYLLSGILFLSYFALIIFFKSKLEKRGTKINLYLVTPLYIALLSYGKISIGLIFTACASYYLIRRYKNFSAPVYYIIVFIMIYILPKHIYSPVKSLSNGNIGDLFSILDYYNVFLNKKLVGIHFLTVFAYSIIFILWSIRNEKNIKDIWGLCKRGKLISVEVLILSCFLGILPGNIIHIASGSAWYFVSVQQIIAVGLLIAYNVPNELFEILSKKKSISYRICSYTLFICLAHQFLYNVWGRLCSFENVIYDGSINEGASSRIEKSYYSEVSAINKITEGHKSDYYIYVDDTADIWKRFDKIGTAVWFYPAFTGVVCIGEIYNDENGNVYFNDGTSEAREWGYVSKYIEPRMTWDDAIDKAREDNKKAVIRISNNHNIYIEEIGD